MPGKLARHGLGLAGRSPLLYYYPMNKRVAVADLLLLLTAAVWGFGFVAQRQGMQYVGPFTFNGLRFILGSLSLLPIAVWLGRGKPRAGGKKPFIFPSFLAGTCLFTAVTFQQVGMMFTTAGNAGFITGLYVILVPVFGVFLGKKTGKATWVGAALTFTGLFFISSGGTPGAVNPGDLLIAGGAVFWAFHVLLIDTLVQKTSPVVLSAGQFVFAGLYALAAAFTVEPPLSAWLAGLGPEFHAAGLTSWKSLPELAGGIASGAVPSTVISSALVPILYGGLVSAGIGYTLQVVAQRDAPPAHATILLCLEGCFAVLGGVLILKEPLGFRTITGCALMLSGMLASQWELISSRKKAAVPGGAKA